MKWFALILIVCGTFCVEPTPAVAQENVISGFLKSLLSEKKMKKRHRKVEEALEAEEMAHEHAEGDQFQIINGRRVHKNAVKKERAVRQTRLDSHFEAYIAWVDDVCHLSEKQKTGFQAFVTAAIKKSQEEYVKQQGVKKKHGSRQLFDYSPIQFFDKKGAVSEVYGAGIEANLLKILNDEQKKKLVAAQTERKQAMHDAFLDHVLNKADRELFLTTKKKKQIKDLFPSQLPLLENGLYSFRPQTHYVTEKQITDILTHPPIAFKRIHMNRIQELRRHTNNYITLQSSEGIEGWYRKIDDEVEHQKTKYHSAVAIRLAYLAAEYELTPEQKRYLEVAGKGATVHAVAAWKKATNIQLKQYEKQFANRQGNHFGFSIAGATIFGFDQTPLWVHATKKYAPELSYQVRLAASEKIAVNYVVAMLDQELWLTPQQREKIAVSLKGMQVINFLQHGNQHDLSQLGLAIHGKKRRELEDALTEIQLNALAAIKKQLVKNNSYIMLKSRNNGHVYLHHITP